MATKKNSPTRHHLVVITLNNDEIVEVKFTDYNRAAAFHNAQRVASRFMDTWIKTIELKTIDQKYVDLS